MASPTAVGETASRKEVHIFDTEEDLVASLVDYVVELSARFTVLRGALTVVVSGHSLFKALRFLNSLKIKVSLARGPEVRKQA
ncbi:hypothetical protein EJB05_47824, partial [Eragrostis curvula]